MRVYLIIFLLIIPFQTSQAKFNGFGSIISAIGQGVKAIGNAGKWVWDSALKPASGFVWNKVLQPTGNWVWRDAFGVGSGGRNGVAAAGDWIWRDAFGVGSHGRKGIAAAGEWFGEEGLGVNSRGTKGIAAAGRWIGHAGKSSWSWFNGGLDEDNEYCAQ